MVLIDSYLAEVMRVQQAIIETFHVLLVKILKIDINS